MSPRGRKGCVAASRSWLTRQGQQELAVLPLAPMPSAIRADCVAVLRLLDEQIRRLDEALYRR